jgi:hypothetical protein
LTSSCLTNFPSSSASSMSQPLRYLLLRVYIINDCSCSRHQTTFQQANNHLWLLFIR